MIRIRKIITLISNWTCSNGNKKSSLCLRIDSLGKKHKKKCICKHETCSWLNKNSQNTGSSENTGSSSEIDNQALDFLHSIVHEMNIYESTVNVNIHMK